MIARWLLYLLEAGIRRRRIAVRHAGFSPACLPDRQAKAFLDGRPVCWCEIGRRA